MTPTATPTSSTWTWPQGSWVDPRLGRITVAEWLERWWPTVTNLRPTTRASDEASLRNHVLPVFGDVPLAKLERTRLREWVTDLSDPNGVALAPATAVKAVQVFNKVMRAARDDRLVAHNPVDKLPVPRIPARRCGFSPWPNCGRWPTPSTAVTVSAFK